MIGDAYPHEWKDYFDQNILREYKETATMAIDWKDEVEKLMRMVSSHKGNFFCTQEIETGVFLLLLVPNYFLLVIIIGGRPE